MDFLLETVPKFPVLNEGITLLLKNLQKPILILRATDVVSYFDDIMHFMGFLGKFLDVLWFLEECRALSSGRGESGLENYGTGLVIYGTYQKVSLEYSNSLLS